MSELTPERIRAAAEVVERLMGASLAGINAATLYKHAELIERQRVEEEKRGRRVEELAREVHQMAWPTDDYAGTLTPNAWPRIARGLLERYPSLAEGAV